MSAQLDFIKLRLAEEKALAVAAGSRGWLMGRNKNYVVAPASGTNDKKVAVTTSAEISRHIARNSPGMMLQRIEFYLHILRNKPTPEMLAAMARQWEWHHDYSPEYGEGV